MAARWAVFPRNDGLLAQYLTSSFNVKGHRNVENEPLFHAADAVVHVLAPGGVKSRPAVPERGEPRERAVPRRIPIDGR